MGICIGVLFVYSPRSLKAPLLRPLYMQDYQPVSRFSNPHDQGNPNGLTISDDVSKHWCVAVFCTLGPYKIQQALAGYCPKAPKFSKGLI